MTSSNLLLVFVISFLTSAFATDADLIRKADALERSGKFREAESLLRSAVSVNPNSAPLHGELGVVLLRQAKYESSVEELGAAVQIDPDSPKYVTLLAEGLIGWGHFGVAVDFLHAAESRIGRTSAYHYDLGLAYYNLNQRRDAEAEFREAIRIDPGLDRAQFMLAACYSDDHEITKALEIYRGLVKKRPRDYASWISLCEALGQMDSSQWSDALGACRRGLAIRPRGQHGQFVTATILIRMSKFGEARPILEELEKENPSAIPIHFNLWRVYTGLGQSTLAQKEEAIAKKLQERQSSEDLPSPPATPAP